MRVLHYGDERRGKAWAEAIARQLPDIDFRCWPDDEHLAETTHLVAWTLPDLLVSALPKLEVLFSVGAGIDQLALDRLPPNVRVIRMIEPGITETMADYVSMAVLALHRNLPFHLAAQRAGEWIWRDVPPARERKVGIMGLGELGRAALAALAPHGFELHGWSRSRHDIDGVRCFAGQGELAQFLGSTDIVACLLPLTDETRGILCRATFAMMRRGSSLINAGRGGHLVQDDLLEALEMGQLSAVMLDVTTPEPLPAGHPFYAHPSILLTPHVAGITRTQSAVTALIGNLRQELEGLPLIGEVNLQRGY